MPHALASAAIIALSALRARRARLLGLARRGFCFIQTIVSYSACHTTLGVILERTGKLPCSCYTVAGRAWQVTITRKGGVSKCVHVKSFCV
jgi:hypothetical protein